MKDYFGRLNDGIKKVLARDEKGRWFIKIWDKVDTTEVLADKIDRYCPPTIGLILCQSFSPKCEMNPVTYTEPGGDNIVTTTPSVRY